MAGTGVVPDFVKALALNKLPINVIGVILPVKEDMVVGQIKLNADLTTKSLGTEIIVAHFLKQFMNGVARAHLGIAGVEIFSSSPRAFMVVLLYEFTKQLCIRSGVRK